MIECIGSGIILSMLKVFQNLKITCVNAYEMELLKMKLFNSLRQLNQIKEREKMFIFS